MSYSRRDNIDKFAFLVFCLATGCAMTIYGSPETFGSPTELVCPALLDTTVHGQFEMVGAVRNEKHKFQTLSIVEGTPGDEKRYAPVVLVPDINRVGTEGRISVWDVAPPRDRTLLMICSYQGTESYLRATIPTELRQCELTLDRTSRVGRCR